MAGKPMADTPSQDRPHALHEIKGVLTKFMRMLHPQEFRLDSIANCGPMLAFHYPLLAGEMIHLPEQVEALAPPASAYDYYFVIAAHLAGRHEFGTFNLRLADLSGFEDRGETGVEAIESFVGAFADPTLGGALMRLCEAVRVDAELARRYRGLAPRVARLNRALAERLSPRALSTILVRAALGFEDAGEDPSAMAFAAHAAEFFTPLRAAGADVVTSARQAAALYQWLQDLIEAARRTGAAEGLDGEADALRNDLIGSLESADGQGEGEGSSEGEGEGETNQNVRMEAAGRPSKGRGGRPLSPEEIRKLLEQGAQIKPAEGEGEADGEGMYLTQLTGKQAQDLEQLREQLGEIGPLSNHGRLVLMHGRGQDSYYAYDEWDYVLADYRRNWCRLREVQLSGDDSDFFAQTLARYSDLLPQVRRHFQRIRPASYRMVRGLEDGEELDLERLVETRVARLMGESPDPRVYRARKKESRDVATLFLLDMSASTDEPIHRETRKAGAAGDDDTDDWMKVWQRRPQQSQRPRRIIDVNKEALVIMAEALEEIGDAYAIMGFSGHGRDNVEFYVIKEFGQELSDEVKARVGAVEPKRSTRMGAAIRHVREKFKDVSSRAKHVILLSDGFPQDFDYGHDRRSNAYGIQDTMVALKELEMAGVLPFCITVDRTGHDYLRQMCSASRYLVIEDIAALPRQLPKIYEQVVRW
ncbi:MAG TPA: VWA domain-containing protein [Candidatus Binataceae bacterium]|nr:VWA domain-containing protein [Candidatus Binataceae bacterium]